MKWMPSRVGAPALALLLPAMVSAQGAPGDSVVYRLLPESRLEAKTGKSGLFSFAGHEHLIRADSVHGTLVFFPATPTRSHVEIVLATAGLEVLTPPDTAEIRKVTQAMRTEVLRVDSFPEIRFASTAVTPIAGGFHVVGDFTLAGQTHPVAVDLKTTIGPDTLRSEGSFAVQQTAYGIKPFRGGPGGVVRVADKVTILLSVVAARPGE